MSQTDGSQNIVQGRRRLSVALCAVTLAIYGTGVAIPAAAQQQGKFKNLFDSLDPEFAGQTAAPELDIDVALTAESFSPGNVATLAVTIRLPAEYYIYSTNPVQGGATRISLSETNGLQAIDNEFRADREPEVVYEELLQQEVEKFFDRVIWTRRFRILPGAQPGEVRVAGTLEGQYCSGGPAGRCIPIRPPHEFAVALEQGSAPTGSTPTTVSGAHPYVQEVRPSRGKLGSQQQDPIVLRFELSPQTAQPGEEVTLTITAVIDEEWHTFALTQDPAMSGLPTKIELANMQGLQPVDATFRPSAQPETERPLDDIVQQVHYSEISWTRRFTVEPTAVELGYGASGSIRYQLCREGMCLPAQSVEFALGHVEPTENTSAFANTEKFDTPDSADSLWFYILSAFFGGMILNVMPCVLPVIAIKVMSFVQQAGENRGRILVLNLTYAVGVISVFLVLATLTVSLQLGWGGLFRRPEFNVVMACLVFAMGLSLLGVFDIPVPGFVGSAAGQQRQEGLLGAFLTGVLATLLATPCSGPFLGATLGWSVRQPVPVTYLVWTVMGVGMAVPYVVFGLFPGAIKWLPKPGNWMVRFKEFCGFVLMGTVIFIISFIDDRYTIPVLIMLMGIALGLWMIGNLYDPVTHIRRKWTVRLTAFALTAGICWFGYNFHSGIKLPWQPFSESTLQQMLSQNRTVLVDFTADWCLTCKANETFALNTKRTLNLVEEHGVVPLYADYTNESDEIRRWLEKFDSISVPLTVIFPADRPTKPIVLRDVYTQRTLLEKLREAVEPAGMQAQRAAALVN